VVFCDAIRDLMPPVTHEWNSHGIRSLLEAQHGVIGRRQLVELGVHRLRIARWLEAGRLVEVHPGAYGMGHAALRREGRFMAAVLSAGPGAVLSHAAAAALWQLRPGGRTEVTTTRNVRREFRVHRVRALLPEHTTSLHAIPCTTPMRTLADIAEGSSTRQIERAVDNAYFHELFDLTALAPILDARRRRPGAARLTRLLEGHRPGTTQTRSRNEEAFLALIDRAGLPRPELNARLLLSDGTPITVDALWADSKLIAEIDVFHTHDARPTTFETDRRRDALLQAMGYTVVRFTARQLAEDPAHVVATVRQLLRRTRGAAT
jgi:hypothetical protein